MPMKLIILYGILFAALGTFHSVLDAVAEMEKHKESPHRRRAASDNEESFLATKKPFPNMETTRQNDLFIMEEELSNLFSATTPIDDEKFVEDDLGIQEATREILVPTLQDLQDHQQQASPSMEALTNDQQRSEARNPRRKTSKENEESVLIHFDPLPVGEEYQMLSLGFQDGVYIFTYLGDFLSSIQPYDFPVEFLRDVLWKKMSIISLIFQSLKVEAGFVVCVTTGILLSLVVPSLSIAATCSTLCVPAKRISDSSSISSNEAVNCTKRSLAFSLFLLIIIIGAGVTAMFVTNEQLSSAVLATPRVWDAAVHDVSAFVKNTRLQLNHVTIDALEKAISFFFRDLDDVDELLGKPIQKQVAVDTGVDVALDALVDVVSVAEGLAKKVQELEQTSRKVQQLTSEAKDRLADLRGQVSAMRRACASNDRPLCDTVEPSGLDIVLKTDEINRDPNLKSLRSLPQENLSKLTITIRERFHNIPNNVAKDTKIVRDAIRRNLEKQKLKMEGTVFPMDKLSEDIEMRVQGARRMAEPIIEALKDIGHWGWLFLLVTSIVLSIIWLLLTISLIYSCCYQEGKSKSLLCSSVVLSSIFSIIFWIIAMGLLLAGGHSEIFVCRSLYDPEYKTLTELLDDPAILFENRRGFFKNILPRNHNFSVSIKHVLSDCKDNNPSKQALKLNNILEMESESNFRTWEVFEDQMKNLNGNFTQLSIFDSILQTKLNNLLQATSVNLTSHRSVISKALISRDLTSFAKQLDSVANQIKDLSTASRVETLASRTRRVINTNIQPLESTKEELVFQLTSLEVQLIPLQRQVNQSISHLKTIQYYLNNQGRNISEMKSAEYTRRLTSYLEQYQRQLVKSLDSTLGPCRPLFDVFHGVRQHFCRQVMDPLNGFWFALVCALLALIIVTPVSLNLMLYYNMQKGLLDSSGGQENGNW